MKQVWKTYVKVAINLTIAVIVLLACIYLLPGMIRFFMPFILGWIISCIGAPIARFLESKLRITRQIGSAFIIVAGISVGILVCYGITSWFAFQIAGFLDELPGLWESFSSKNHNLGLIEGVAEKFLPDDLAQSISEFGDQLLAYVADLIARIGSSTETMEAMGNMAGKVPNFIIGIFMCVLSAYFFIAEREHLTDYCNRCLPVSVTNRAAKLWNSLAGVIGGYIKAQVKIEVWIYLLLVIGFLILKVPFGAVIALGIAFIDFLPVFGSGFIMWPWAVVAFLDSNMKLAVGLLILWGLGQAVRQMIQPKIVGDSMGLAPLPTLFLIYIGYQIGGFGGMIFAVPIGILLRNMYAEGLFDNTINSIKILFRGVNRFRRFTPEELGDCKVHDDTQKET